MKIALIKSLDNTFKIAFDNDYEQANKIKVGEPYEYEYKNARNLAFHRKYFGLLNTVISNTEAFKDVNHLRAILCIEIGYYDELINPLTGEIKIIPKSISFSKMDNVEFEELYNKSIDYCCKVLLVDRQELIDHILSSL